MDFSDAISRSRMTKGYDALSNWELAPVGEPETAFQKFLRLKARLLLSGLRVLNFDNFVFLLLSVKFRS